MSLFTKTDADVSASADDTQTRRTQASSRPWMRPSGMVISGGRILIVLVFLAVWQLASGRWVDDYLISSPTQVIERSIALVRTGEIVDDFQVTAVEFFLGYVLGVAIGLTLGLLLGGWPLWGRLLEPLIAALNGIPKIALAPLIILWLGIGIGSKVGIAVMTVFFVMFYNVYIGMRDVPRALVNSLRIMGATRGTILRVVVLPHLTTAILAGLRSGVPFAVIGVIVGEFVASTQGLGYYIRTSSESYDAGGIFAGIAFLMVLVFAMNLVVTVWERRATRWQR